MKFKKFVFGSIFEQNMADAVTENDHKTSNSSRNLVEEHVNALGAGDANGGKSTLITVVSNIQENSTFQNCLFQPSPLMEKIIKKYLS